MALELRGVRLRRALDRKKVEGCARDAMRRIEVDDIGKGCCLVVVFEDFRGAFCSDSNDFRDQARPRKCTNPNRACSNWLRHVVDQRVAECR